MVEGRDSDDEGDQRANAGGDPSEPPPGSTIGTDSSVTIGQEPSVELDVADARWLADHLGDALGVMEPLSEGHRVAQVSIRVVGDPTMSEAHLKWCGVEGSTDVITFHGIESNGLHVDLLLCIDEAERRSAELGHETRRELLLYAVHGVLHCLGHDDRDPDSFERMHREEDRVLRAIGVGPVFRPGGETA
ncbi:MAG: rRNA maturation RNase YbeY [Phycisphaera sp.]|nr:rRNA maturation RNase YbeY [Phycisphaera sp.]